MLKRQSQNNIVTTSLYFLHLFTKYCIS